MQTIQKKKIESLYTLKCIASFFVVLIHSEFFLKDILSFISGIGTPCFLAITGYLLYSNDQKREIDKCFSWAKKSFFLSIFCNFIYLIACFYKGTQLPLTDSIFWIKLLLRGHQICISLWYLTALWESLLIIYLLIKYIPKAIYILPFLFICVYLIANSNTPLFESNYAFFSRHSILTSLPFLATGYLIRKHYHILSKLKIEVLLTVFLVFSFAENIFYIRYLNHHSVLHISTYPLVVLVILLCVKHPNFKLPFVTIVGKNHSPNIYYYHMLLLMLSSRLWQNGWLHELSDFQAAIIWLMCIPISYAIIFLRDGVRTIQQHLISFHPKN